MTTTHKFSSLTHLNAAVGEEDGPVPVHVHKGASLQEMGLSKAILLNGHTLRMLHFQKATLAHLNTAVGEEDGPVPVYVHKGSSVSNRWDFQRSY